MSATSTASKLVAAAAATALIGAAIGYYRVAADRDRVAAAFASYRAQVEANARVAVEKAREDERQIQEQQRKELDEAHVALTAARKDAGAARTALDRLRERARSAAAGQQCPAADPQPASPGSAASNPAGVLADLLVEAGEVARRYAEIADAARIAGQLCERDYDALTSGR